MVTGLQGLPPQVGRYELRRLLGRGGMGRVVLGHDPVLRRDVAIKIVEPAAVAIEDLAELRFMFHREARATAALRHPNIVEVFDYSGPDADLMFIACELIDGPTLHGVLLERDALPVSTAVAVGYELASALDEAHRRGIVHRDLKPENVFWTPSGRVVLSDFGIAKAFDGSNRLGGTIEFGGTSLYGSPSYMAPEQLEGGTVGPPTDIYALGVLLYECLSGTQAFGGSDVPAILEAVVRGEHVPVERRATLPVKLARLVESMLHVNPRERPAHAKQIGRELRAILDGLGVSDPRLTLRDFGEATAIEIAAAAPDAESATHQVTAPPPASSLASPHVSPRPRARGLGLAALALVMLVAGGAAVWRLAIKRVGEIATAGGVTSSETSESSVGEVRVRLLLDVGSRVEVDGREVGTWDTDTTLALPLGRHRLVTRRATGVVSKDVLLLRGTTPTFDLRHP